MMILVSGLLVSSFFSRLSLASIAVCYCNQTQCLKYIPFTDRSPVSVSAAPEHEESGSPVSPFARISSFPDLCLRPVVPFGLPCLFAPASAVQTQLA